MIITNKKQNNVLEKFRIKAHLRRYIKDPVIVDEALLFDAVQQLKKLPYKDKDPSETVAIELVLEAYRLGLFKYRDLTVSGYDLVSQSKYRGHQQLSNNRIFSELAMRHTYVLRSI